MYGMCGQHADGEIGIAFSYAAWFGVCISVWMMLLYGRSMWIATTGKVAVPSE